MQRGASAGWPGAAFGSDPDAYPSDRVQLQQLQRVYRIALERYVDRLVPSMPVPLKAVNA